MKSATRNRLLLPFATLGILLALVLWRVVDRPPSAVLTVVDGSGRPIAGATLRPDGIRPKQRSGDHYWWPSDSGISNAPVVTDARGRARVSYPRFVAERLETREISFSVSHPDFVPDRPFRVVDPRPAARAPWMTKIIALAELVRDPFGRLGPEPVILTPGAILEVVARLPDGTTAREGLHIQTSQSRGRLWSTNADGARVCRQIAAGHTAVRAVLVRPDQSLAFSEVATFEAVSGETRRLELDLRDGATLKGTFDDAVPRPVVHGRVHLQVQVAVERIKSVTDRLLWEAWTDVRPDGSFLFADLPPGPAEIIGICEGYLSANGPGTSTLRRPQPFELEAPETTVSVAMERAGAVAVIVRGPDGEPVQGARVSFWPNVIWGNYGSRIFGEPPVSTAERLRDPAVNGEGFDRSKSRFVAASDAQGVALVDTLPDGNASFAIFHDRFELPIQVDAAGQEHRTRGIQVVPGRTNRLEVGLIPSGRRFIRE